MGGEKRNDIVSCQRVRLPSIFEAEPRLGTGYMDSAIVTLGLTKRYGATAGITDLNLHVRRGEVCGFLGPNGAGKTTTIRLLLGLLRPTHGTMEILGLAPQGNRRSLLRRMGYLPGDIGLYRDLTGTEYLHHLLRLRTGRPSGEIRARLAELQDRFELDFHRKIGTYSKGMRQSVGILQAFMHRPELVILDEPTSGLDPIMQERFYELLSEERQRGTTVFLSSHILTEAARVCDRVVMVKGGRLVRVDEVEAYKARLGKRITIETRSSARAFRERIENLRGVSQMTEKENQLQFFFNGDMQTLIQGIGQIDITDFMCEPAAIEQVFMGFYGEQQGREH